MGLIEEANYMLQSASDEDIERFSDGDGMSERIREWLDTPEGSLLHDPSWGHNLTPFKHDPLSSGGDIETLIQMALVRKMPIDIDDLQIVAVKVEVTDIDMFTLSVIHEFGNDILEVRL